MEGPTEFCKNCKRNVVVSNFASHSAFCERKIKLCEVCDEPVQISDFKEHEEEYHAMVACEMCDAALQKWMLPKHQESCLKRLVPCEFCEAEFPYDVHAEHTDFCGSKTEKCTYCRKYIMLKDKASHYECNSIDMNDIMMDLLCSLKAVLEDHKSVLFITEDLSVFTAHRTIIKKMKDNVKNEIEQNSVNEVISETCFTSQAEEKLQFSKKETEETLHEHAASNNNTRKKFQLEQRSGTASGDEFKNFNKRYGICHICKEHIPWVDMNTHIPTCASSAGRCSLCGDSIPPREIKDHILRTCPMLKKVPTGDASDGDIIASGRNRDYETSWTSAIPEETRTTKSCPYCEQICDEERILEHVRNCEQNTYECPLCLKILPEKDKQMHESFDCEVLLNIHRDDGCTRMTQSYSESVKRNDRRRNLESTVYNTQACPICRNNITVNRLKGHVEVCQRNMKPCKFCGTFIKREDEKIHLSICKKVTYDVSSSYSHSTQNRGAVPKYSVPNQMKQESESTMCVKCDVCENYVPVKEIEIHKTEHNHKCCHKKGKRCNCGKEKNEGNNHGPVKRFWNQVKSFAGYEGKEGDTYSYEENSRTSSQSYQPSCIPKSHSNVYDESLYFSTTFNQEASDPLIPCEFCEETFPMSKIIEHSTGCKPDIVSFTSGNRNDGDNNENKNKSSIQEQTRSEMVNRSHSSDRTRFFETSTSLRPNRFKQSDRQSHDIPGEFLNDNKSIVNKNITKYGNAAPEVDQAFNNANSESSKIISVWNFTGTSSVISSESPEFSSNTIKKHVEDNENNVTSNSACSKEDLNNELKKSADTNDDISAFINFISKKEILEINNDEEKIEKFKKKEKVSYLSSKEGPNVYEEEKPKMYSDSKIEPSFKLPQVCSSQVKQTSCDSDSEPEGVDSTVEALVKLGELSIENIEMDVDNTIPEDTESDKQKCSIETGLERMNINNTLPEDIELNKQECAFKIEPAIQNLSLEKNENKKTWKIELLSNKITEDSTKIDIVKPCLANFKFGSTKNVTYDENAMDCEDSFVKDVNENRKDQPLKCNPGEILLKNGITSDKVAANFYDNIQESHENFIKSAYNKIYCEKDRSDPKSANEERPSVEEWIKRRSTKSSDSE